MVLAPRKRRRAKSKPKPRMAPSKRQKEKESEQQRERLAGRIMLIAMIVLGILAIAFTIIVAAR